MKTKSRQILAFSTVVALTLSVAVTSCKKDKDEDANSGASAQFAANVGGVAFKPNTVEAYTFFNFIMISGKEGRAGGDSVLLELSIPNTVTENSKFTFDDNIGLDYYNEKKTFVYENYGDAHGTVNFTTVDKTNKKIAGTFSGVLYSRSTLDSVVVKDGKFNTTYISQ
jgi:hypothetical protein